ncbi:MAG: DHHA1 domain-containing protein, partial [Candidatus Sulfotelmatobacter sp.]
LASTSPQPSLVFAQTAGQPFDMGSLLKETVGKMGGRGGGSKDLAQGGVPNSEALAAALKTATEKIANQS